ncbi:MAG: hypothetical protein J3R72DRAFT_440054 [Linnemannia gamsii]|nr:MAG: hypothetical protein J3R72DRAFT_440054 [Linnemannia gamsii]
MKKSTITALLENGVAREIENSQIKQYKKKKEKHKKNEEQRSFSAGARWRHRDAMSVNMKKAQFGGWVSTRIVLAYCTVTRIASSKKTRSLLYFICPSLSFSSPLIFIPAPVYKFTSCTYDEIHPQNGAISSIAFVFTLFNFHPRFSLPSLFSTPFVVCMLSGV